MPIPYRRAPRALVDGSAAFFDVLFPGEDARAYGGLLVLDGKGEPLEFVYNTVESPTGFLWPVARSREASTVALAHSLFDACRREPDVLFGAAHLAGVEFCRQELATGVPFALVQPGDGAVPVSWVWVNEPPPPGSRAAAVFESLQDRRMLQEPFQRVTRGLEEVFTELRAGEW